MHKAKISFLKSQRMQEYDRFYLFMISSKMSCLVRMHTVYPQCIAPLFICSEQHLPIDSVSVLGERHRRGGTQWGPLAPKGNFAEANPVFMLVLCHFLNLSDTLASIILKARGFPEGAFLAPTNMPCFRNIGPVSFPSWGEWIRQKKKMVALKLFFFSFKTYIFHYNIKSELSDSTSNALKLSLPPSSIARVKVIAFFRYHVVPMEVW